MAGKSKPEHGKFPIREDRVDRIEVHVAGICLREAGKGWKILAAKRKSSWSLFPNKWECGGGMVRRGESFQAAVKRQMFEEFGLTVEPWFIVEAYEISTPRGQRVIPGVRFVCLCQSPETEVRLNTREFSDFRWLKLPLKEHVDWIGGLDKTIAKVVTPRLLSKSRREPLPSNQDF